MRERNLKALVARAQGCLSSLPQQQRRLLRLRSGLGQTPPLGGAATAARLHLGPTRFGALEARALRELRQSSAGGCGESATATAADAAGAIAFLGTSFGDSQAAGEVKAVRYEAGAASPIPPAVTSDTNLLGGLSPAERNSLIGFGSLLLAGLAMFAIVADASGKGPRHTAWRRRMRKRIRSRL
jgi:hypothetical protein